MLHSQQTPGCFFIIVIALLFMRYFLSVFKPENTYFGKPVFNTHQPCNNLSHFKDQWLGSKFLWNGR